MKKPMTRHEAAELSWQYFKKQFEHDAEFFNMVEPIFFAGFEKGYSKGISDKHYQDIRKQSWSNDDNQIYIQH